MSNDAKQSTPIPKAIEALRNVHLSEISLLLETIQPESNIMLSNEVKAKLAKELAEKTTHKVVAVGEQAFLIGLYAGCEVMLKSGVVLNRLTIKGTSYCYVEFYDVLFFTEPEQ